LQPVGVSKRIPAVSRLRTRYIFIGRSAELVPSSRRAS
jgi:hypothetical protein